MTSLVAIQPNPLYPLPPDYLSLTGDGQRQARVNACRQWCLPPSPTIPPVGDRRIASTHFFDHHYLRADPESGFDPLFYDVPPLTTPAFHWDLSRMWADSSLTVAMAPRGGAKSTHLRRDALLLAVSSPTPFSQVYCTSTHDNARLSGQALRDQCYGNPRIADDFGIEHGTPSRLQPGRGDKPAGVDFFYLTSGAWFRLVSSGTRLRGLRPRRFRLDDPEYDESGSTSMQAIRDFMDRLLFKVCIPMVLRAHCGIDWIGTFVSKRHYLWHAMSLLPSTDAAPRALDSRFDHWSRLLIRAAYEDPNTHEIRSCWPEMWPATRAEKILLNLPPSTISLEEMPSIMGSAAFRGEMLGDPGSSDDQFFHLDVSSQGRHAYWLTDVDPLVSTQPASSTTLIHYLHPSTSAVVTHTLRDFVASSRLFITVDTAFTEKSSSDRRCCCLMALAPDNILVVLDLWSDRRQDSVLLNETFRLCQLWFCPTIAVETVKESFKLYHRFRSAITTRLLSDMGFSFIPRVHPLKIGLLSKTDKISGLDSRFEHGLIKLPLWRRFERPWWTRLFEQIEGFNPDLSDGGLEKDDEIDCVSMSAFVIKGRLLRKTPTPDAASSDPFELLRTGERNLPGTSVPIVSGLPLSAIPSDLLSTLLTPEDPTTRLPSRV